MNKKTFILLLFSLPFLGFHLAAQNSTPATIVLKNGKKIEAIHFGQLNCSGNSYFDSYISIKGKYKGTYTELHDYSKISNIEFLDFTEPPGRSIQPEEGKLVITRKNGVTATLEDATVKMSCYGNTEMFNEIKVQIRNPITDQKAEQTIDVKDINKVIFP
ncbi:MAG TPA: hypothetical protein VE912_05830 [Bacteroidales bacterium]|nr:hypothetical protein [Bacteroidales bacterium]